jgi:hypothetical protein
MESSGEVHRLRRLDHLGAVRLAFEGAHHSRWEYVATVLALIDRSAAISRTQLKSQVRRTGQPLASTAEELLKSWALLLNVGHMPWTFSAERILLQELWRNRPARRAFIGTLPEPMRPHAARVIRDGDYYSLYQLLIPARIRQLEAAGFQAPDFWEPFLLTYLEPDTSEQIARARAVFRRLRRVAYLGLDTQYAPTAVTLDLGRVLADDRTLERHALADSDADQSELIELDAHMARTVYLARGPLNAAVSSEDRLRQRIRTGLGSDLGGLLKSLAEGTYQADLPKEDLVPGVRVVARALPPLDIFLSENVNPRREEESFRAELRHRRARALPVLWTVPGRTEWVLQIAVGRGMSADAAQALCAVMARLRTYRNQMLSRLTFLNEVALQDLLLGQIARDLVNSALGIAFGDSMRWEWTSTDGPPAVLAPRSIARRIVTTEAQSAARLPDSGARRAELDLLFNMLLGRPSEMSLAAIASIRGYLPDERVPVVEFDAVVVEERLGRLELRIGEAKTGAGSANLARTELSKKLKRVSVSPAATLVGPTLIQRRLRKTQGRVRSRAVVTLSIEPSV